MAKSSLKSRRLKRSRHVSSFMEDSMESATPMRTTMNIVADIHNEDERSQRLSRSHNNDVELSDDKETKQSEQSAGSSKVSSRRASRASRDRDIVVVSRDHSSDKSRDHLIVESFDLIEEIGASERHKVKPLPEVKPRRRKQWNTVNSQAASGEAEDARKPPRKRWSKDTSVIRLPETTDASPLINNHDNSRKPVPAPRTSARRNAFFFDNPAFASENEEVLRIETDHRQEKTKIEMRRMSAHSNIKNIEDIEDIENVEETNASGSSNSREFNKRSGADKSRERSTESDARSSKARSTRSKKKSSSDLNSSSSSGKVSGVRSSSMTLEEESTGEKKKSQVTQERSFRKREKSTSRRTELLNDDETSSSVRDTKSIIESDTNARIKKKKRKKRKQGKEEERTEEEKEEMKYISVTIHRADILEADYASVKRPMVKVHIVNARTGDYLKSNRDNQENGSVFLQPMITSKFDFKENRSMIPVWEEELIFEYDFNAITRHEEEGRVLILFEVLDLLSFAEASFSYDKFGREGSWNKIAWAFLKPLGINDTLHTDKKIRLQLYKPKRSFKRYEKRKCEVYTWWQSNNRDKYPSSLFVTVTSVLPPKHEPVYYRQLALNEFSDTRSGVQGISTRTSDSISLPKWARLAAQSCKIPNEKMFETEVNENGCFYVAFSCDGKYLACVHSEEYNYPIVVYEVASGKIHVRFLGHKTFVYSLNWSSDDHHLLSASTDQTACVWDVRNQIVQHVEMLPHPSYVYCAKYGPDNTTIVATGCYDQVARIWANDKRLRKRELSQELEGHEGFVNSIVFQKNNNLLTADSIGVIIVWTVRKNGRLPSKREWCISRKIKVREIEGVVINTIALHPLESRLLVHSRNNSLRMLDLATGVVLRKYNRLNNQRIQTKACISPCGGLIFCGGEDSVLNVWNLETGKQLACYKNANSHQAVTCVDYHPYDHVLAYSSFGNPAAVQVLRFNKTASSSEVGLKTSDSQSRIYERKSNTNPELTSNFESLSPTQSNEFPSQIRMNLSDDFRIYKTQSLKREPHLSQASKNLQRLVQKVDKLLCLIKTNRTQTRHNQTNLNSNADDSCTLDSRLTQKISLVELEHLRRKEEDRYGETTSSSELELRYHTINERRSRSAQPSKRKTRQRSRCRTLSEGVVNRVDHQDDHSVIGIKNNIATSLTRKNSDDICSDSTVISIEEMDISKKPQESSEDSGGTYVINMMDHYDEENKPPNEQCVINME